MEKDATSDIRDQVLAARGPVRLVGGGTKQFYGREVEGVDLNLGGHRGILSYDPAELVLTARAGTPLADIEAALAGTIACGIAGPARAYAGAIKDFVLGVTLMNGEGKVLRFGGQVMKNVAGYDIARTTVGSLGTLGVLMDVSLKVLPSATFSATRVFELDAPIAFSRLSAWAGQPSCISATCWIDGGLHLRLTGSEAAVEGAASRLGGEPLDGAGEFWRSVREQTHVFFNDAAELIRVAVPSLTAPSVFGAPGMMEWSGAQRWFKNPADAGAIRAAAVAAGGFATFFRTRQRNGEVFQPLPTVQMRLQQSLKAVFDPRGMFNRGRLYPAM
jgi:glycolate oxidase FAD binding subunit